MPCEIARPLRSPFDSRFDCAMGESAMPINRSGVEHHRWSGLPCESHPLTIANAAPFYHLIEPTDFPRPKFPCFSGPGTRRRVALAFKRRPATISLYRPFTPYYAGLSAVFQKFPLKLLPPGTAVFPTDHRPSEIPTGFDPALAIPSLYSFSFVFRLNLDGTFLFLFPFVTAVFFKGWTCVWIVFRIYRSVNNGDDRNLLNYRF